MRDEDMNTINNLIIASWLIWVVLSLYQIYQHCKGNFKYYKISSRYINFIVLLIVMLVIWFILVCMKVDSLMEV